MADKFCTNCAAKLMPTMLICPNCGNKSFASTPPTQLAAMPITDVSSALSQVRPRAGRWTSGIGGMFYAAGVFIYLIGGFWGLFLSVGIIHDKFGLLGTVISLLVFPFTLYLAPWWAGFADGNWQPLFVTYGTTGISYSLILIGSLLNED